jgi:hypothetical protein
MCLASVGMLKESASTVNALVGLKWYRGTVGLEDDFMLVARYK